MSADFLTVEAKRENAAMLASALGLSIAEATQALELDIAITVRTTDSAAMLIAHELMLLLKRTVKSAAVNRAEGGDAIEVLIGDAAAMTHAPILRVVVTKEKAFIGCKIAAEPCEKIHGTLAVLSACYAAAATIQAALGGRLPFNVNDPLKIEFAELGVSAATLEGPIELGHAYMAGTGAIGNGFLWAGRHLDLRGKLDVVDDDTVSSGNLNRQIWFSTNDIGFSKADRLATHARPHFPHLIIAARQMRLQDLPERTDGPWLERLIVAVDSRRARRALQDEFPGEVFDASTTDIREVVVHYNKQVTDKACLSCIYEPDSQEFSREQHIADHLGVSVSEVRKERISLESASIIVRKYSNIAAQQLVGTSYDTLFKQLCGEGQLQTLEGRRVVAPFAFASVLAGCLLALEVARRVGEPHSKRDFNYWRVSPWHSPLSRRQILRPRQTDCAFCGNTVKRNVNHALWDHIPGGR